MKKLKTWLKLDETFSNDINDLYKRYNEKAPLRERFHSIMAFREYLLYEGWKKIYSKVGRNEDK